MITLIRQTYNQALTLGFVILLKNSRIKITL
jgi:hypothetical protein